MKIIKILFYFYRIYYYILKNIFYLFKIKNFFCPFGMWRDLVARNPTGLVRMFRKTFSSVYIKAAPLIVKKIAILQSWFKQPRDLIPEEQRFSYVYQDCFTWRVLVEREKHVL